MKFIVGLLVVIFKFYCAFKICQWLYLQVFDKTTHPISEIQHILVFIVLDIWLMMSVGKLEESMDIKV
jgi:hypothetical protein